MKTSISTVAINEEKKEIEKWVNETYGTDAEAQINILSLILYKLHLLEEKIAKIEYQTKTHWVN